MLISEQIIQFLQSKPWRRPEVWLAILILLLAFVSRFYDLESRVMSHDESEHTYFSWLFAKNGDYQHTPITHGPLQFHLLALTYKIFGDSDATSRFPAALSGVIAIGMLFFFKRWLGRAGSLVAMVVMLVSPYMLFYSRYVRNEAFILPVALLMFMAVFRYFETRQNRWLYLLAASLTLHYLIKETAFMYTVELMLFVAAVLVWQLVNRPWKSRGYLIAFLLGLVAFLIGVAILFFNIKAVKGTAEEPGPSPLLLFGLSIALVGLVSAVISVVRSFGPGLRRDYPALDILIVSITVTLPQLAAFPANLLGWDPLDYQNTSTMIMTGIVVTVMAAITTGIGLVWDWRRWQVIAAIFFFPYLIFYTSIFTNWPGLATGLVGSFGYWLAQQEVQRGSQPLYYYYALQIPTYEYLAASGSVLAASLGIREWFRKRRERKSLPSEANHTNGTLPFPAMIFIGYWTVISLLLFSYAGERMPWLTVHIALPMVLLTGWALGKCIDAIRVHFASRVEGWGTLILIAVGLYGLVHALYELLGLSGATAEASANENLLSGDVILHLGLTILVVIGLWILIRMRGRFPVGSSIIAILSIGVFTLTARTAYLAAYRNYDYGTEFLVYAHGEHGVKTVLEKIEECSEAIGDEAPLQFAYDVADGSGDSGVSWPLNWYFRNNPNAHPFGPEITRDLRSYPVLLSSDNNWARLEPLLENYFQKFDYIRMVWPMQDYFQLRWSSIEVEYRIENQSEGNVESPSMSYFNYFSQIWHKIRPWIFEPSKRSAVWQIWFNRDYTQYGQITGRDFSLENWQPSDHMRLYVRNDISAKVWGIGDPTLVPERAYEDDPYQTNILDLSADLVIGTTGAKEGQFQTPRSLAFAPDGSLYVADSMNHRIQHLSPSGDVLHVWGTFADILSGPAPDGTFNGPWGIAVGPDGSVYVADTWNHRIQKFTSDGTFLTKWGVLGYADSPENLWGPRTMTVDQEGRVFVMDTGNKRIMIYDANGQYLSQFGEGGYGPGQLDEPVGFALSARGLAFIADTWNARVQVFQLTESGTFTFLREWPIAAWFGQSLENKPYLALGPDDQVCVTDPEGYRVLCFNPMGDFLFGWGSYGTGVNQFDLPSGIAFDPQGSIWVVDSKNGRLMRFPFPPIGAQ